VKGFTKRLAAFLLALLVGFLVVNKTIYIHSHRLDDGTLVTHAHPFNRAADDDPGKTHHHTSTAFLYISNIDHLLPMLLVSVGFALVAIQLWFRTLAVTAPLPGPIGHPDGRAPPFISL